MGRTRQCQYCRKVLVKDEVAMSKKLCEAETRKGRFTCLGCMSEVLDVSLDDLKEKIEDFKAEGCKLFQ